MEFFHFLIEMPILMPLEKPLETDQTTIEKEQSVEEYLANSREARAKEAEAYFNNIDSQSLKSLLDNAYSLYRERQFAIEFIKVFNGTNWEEYAIEDFTKKDIRYLSALNDYFVKDVETSVKENIEKYPTQEQY
jgi:hypothetical protein